MVDLGFGGHDHPRGDGETYPVIVNQRAMAFRRGVTDMARRTPEEWWEEVVRSRAGAELDRRRWTVERIMEGPFEDLVTALKRRGE